MRGVHEQRYRLDHFLQTLGYEGLNDLGFINIPNASVEPYFAQSGDKTAPRVAGLGVGNSRQAPLHAVIARDRWRHLSDVQWDAIQDSLHLVTRVLDDPSILPFFAGLLDTDSHQEIENSKSKYVLNHRRFAYSKPQSFQPDNDWDVEKQKTVWKLLRSSAASMTWQFDHTNDADVLHHNNLGVGFWGYTTPNGSLPGIPGMTPPKYGVRIGNTVLIHPDYISVLTGQISSNDPAFTRPEHHIDRESALLRTKLHLAMDILHEFLHAFYGSISTLWTPPDSRTDPLPQWPHGHVRQRQEPYFNNQRTNELGYAFITQLLSNILEPIGTITPAAPYGLVSHRWPDMHDTQNTSMPLMSAKKWGLLWSISCAVDMAWVQSVFTQKFWSHDVEKLGMLKALDVPRELGFRRLPRDLDPGESPTILPTKELFDAGIGRFDIPGQSKLQFVANGPFAHLRVEAKTVIGSASGLPERRYLVTDKALPSYTVERKPVDSGSKKLPGPEATSRSRSSSDPGRSFSLKGPASPKILRLSKSWAEKPNGPRVVKPPSPTGKAARQRKRDRMTEAFKKLFHQTDSQQRT